MSGHGNSPELPVAAARLETHDNDKQRRMIATTNQRRQLGTGAHMSTRMSTKTLESWLEVFGDDGVTVGDFGEEEGDGGGAILAEG